MIGNVVADQFLSIGDYPFGAALAIVLTAIVMIALVLLRRGERQCRTERVVADAQELVGDDVADHERLAAARIWGMTYSPVSRDAHEDAAGRDAGLRERPPGA